MIRCQFGCLATFNLATLAVWSDLQLRFPANEGRIATRNRSFSAALIRPLFINGATTNERNVTLQGEILFPFREQNNTR